MSSVAAWKRAALPAVESCLAHQIGPLARVLMKKVADKAEDFGQLAALLVPHIPSEGGRTRFQQELARIRAGLDEDAPLAAQAVQPVRPPLPPGPGPGHGLQEADRDGVDAATRRLVAIVGPIGRVLARRAMEQARDKETFLRLLASHIDNPRERTRFLMDAGAMP
jgi:serine/threonine-protein kinase